MAKSDVLARVKQDLALGHTYLASQRLRTLVAIEPDDLELRGMLAGVYRQTGNQAEAGRWAYLTSELTADELNAFERANPDPWLRLRLLRWAGDEASVPDAAARTRLRTLTEAAGRSGPPSAYQGPLGQARRRRGVGAAIPCLFVLLVLGGIGSLAAIGLVRIIGWVIG